MSTFALVLDSRLHSRTVLRARNVSAPENVDFNANFNFSNWSEWSVVLDTPKHPNWLIGRF